MTVWPARGRRSAFRPGPTAATAQTFGSLRQTIVITIACTPPCTAYVIACSIPVRDEEEAFYEPEQSDPAGTPARCSPAGKPGYSVGADRAGTLQHAGDNTAGRYGLVHPGCPVGARGRGVCLTASGSGPAGANAPYVGYGT